MSDERRNYPRADSKLTVKFKSPKAFLQQYTENISKGGLFIQMDKAPPVGTELKLVLHLPMTRREVEVAGTVQHHRPSDGNEAPGIGVKFTDVDLDSLKLIDAYVTTILEKQAKGRL